MLQSLVLSPIQVRVMNPFDSEFRSGLAGFRIATCLETQIPQSTRAFNIIRSGVGQEIG